MSHSKIETIEIGVIKKPFGLLGEIKVIPSTFDLDRHELLQKVYLKQQNKEQIELKIKSSRCHRDVWYFKFEDYNTPESVRIFTGASLLIPDTDRLEIPSDKIYISDLIGYTALELDGSEIGLVKSIQPGPPQDLIQVEKKGLETLILIPWIDHFVKKIDSDQKTLQVDFSQLKGLYEN